MEVCLVYDCLFPHTVGGAERWYRNLAERLSEDGHRVRYLTLRQWDRGASPDVRGVEVEAVGPRMALYTSSGRRRILPPLVFGLGVLWHLLRHGRRYDVVHTASFPYFSLLAAGVARPLLGYRLVVDWHEVWSPAYWRDYLGPAAGRLGWLVQSLCARIRHEAFCFSQLHADRLRSEGMHEEIRVLRGEFAGPLDPRSAGPTEPLVMFAGRLIPEKRATLGVAGVAAAVGRVPGLRGVFYGDGPERQALDEAILEHNLQDVVSARGFASAEEVEGDMRRALCLLLPSRREGYGLVVVEAAACGTPSIVVRGPDNAATELIEPGINGLIVERPDPEAIAEAIHRIYKAGAGLRQATARWFADNAEILSIESSLDAVLDAYRDVPSTAAENRSAEAGWRRTKRRLLG